MPRGESYPISNLIARIAVLAEGGDLKGTVAGICPNRFHGCLRKSVPCPPLGRSVPAELHLSPVHRYVTSFCAADLVLATGTGQYATPEC